MTIRNLIGDMLGKAFFKEAHNRRLISHICLMSVPEKITSLTYIQGLSDHNVIHDTLTAPTVIKLVSKEVIKLSKRDHYLQINEEPCSFLC